MSYALWPHAWWRDDVWWLVWLVCLLSVMRLMSTDVVRMILCVLNRDLGSCLDNVSVLWLARCATSDLDGIASLSNLRELYLAYNDIVDISPCSLLEYLQILDLEGFGCFVQCYMLLNRIHFSLLYSLYASIILITFDWIIWISLDRTGLVPGSPQLSGAPLNRWVY